MRLTLTGFVRGLFGFLFPARKPDIDWKQIGQLRSRLSNMRLDLSPMKLASVPTTKPIPMFKNFRSLNESVSDRRGLNRWYGQEDAELAEKELQKRIEAGQRTVQEMKMSGNFPAIREEDAAALREVHSRFMDGSGNQSVEEKLASFLSGASDDISDISHVLFGGQAEIHLSESSADDNATKSVRATHDQFVNAIEAASQPTDIYAEFKEPINADDTLQNLPAVTEEILASLERAAHLDPMHETAREDSQSANNSGLHVAPAGKSKSSRNGRARSRAKSNSRSRERSDAAARVLEEACAVQAVRTPDLDAPTLDAVDSLPPSNVAIFRPRARKK